MLMLCLCSHCSCCDFYSYDHCGGAPPRVHCCMSEEERACCSQDRHRDVPGHRTLTVDITLVATCTQNRQPSFPHGQRPLRQVALNRNKLGRKARGAFPPTPTVGGMCVSTCTVRQRYTHRTKHWPARQEGEELTGHFSLSCNARLPPNCHELEREFVARRF